MMLKITEHFPSSPLYHPGPSYIISCLDHSLLSGLSASALVSLLLLLLSRFSHVRLCATPETAAHQAPPSLGFSRQEYWSGVPLPSSIPGSGRSPGEGIGYPLHNSWATLVAHTVKNLPAMQETWVQSLGWEDPLEKGMATHSSILEWRIPWTEEPDRLQSMGSQRVKHN